MWHFVLVNLRIFPISLNEKNKHLLKEIGKTIML